MEKICLQCNKKFSKKKTSCKKSWAIAKFCSKICAAKSVQIKNYTRINKVCIICDKEFTVEKYRKDTAKCCSKECFHKSRNFGLTSDSKKIRNGKEFRKWRELVFEKDDWTCQKCLVRGEELNPHHIFNFSDNEEKRFDVNNGITLCRKCHYDFHSEYGFNNNSLIQIEHYIGCVYNTAATAWHAIAVGVQS
jgi:hypothetical protein